MIYKKTAFIILIVIFILTASISYFLASNKIAQVGTRPTSPQTTSSNVVSTVDYNPQDPKTEECPLNGEMLPKSSRAKWESRRPLGIMIENHVDARPQSGLSAADNIYEAVAEGGITRFLAIFYCHDAPFVGPVRSARIYFLRLLEGYGDHPFYAHVGGANTEGPADALGEIGQLGWAQYNDLNQFSVPFPVYWRDYERLPNRATEHTVYSATAKLWDFAKNSRNLTNVDAKGNAWNTAFTPWKFKDDPAASDRGTVNNLSFGFWNFFASEYAVTWTYDNTSNSYKRTNGGNAHIDKNTGKQLTAKNIVVVFAQESPANDGYPGGHILYRVIGGGNGLLFQDGKASTITWNKKDETSMMRFYDASGREVQFTRGQIFVEILPVGNKVTY